MRRSNKMPPDFAKRVSAGLKTMHARKRREAAQARLNRAAVAWAEHYSAQWHIDISREKAVSPAMKLLRAVRAFQKINASQTKGNK